MTLVFADPKHLQTLESSGRYPKIHDAVFTAASTHTPIKGATLVEFGPCLGLISHRLIEQAGAHSSLGIEANPSYIARAVRHPSIQYVNVCVSGMGDLAPLSPMLRGTGGRSRVAIARRVLSEIWTSGEQPALDAVAQWLHQNDFTHLVLEGRAKVAKPTHPIHSTEIEVEKMELTGLWHLAVRSGAAAVMEAV